MVCETSGLTATYGLQRCAAWTDCGVECIDARATQRFRSDLVWAKPSRWITKSAQIAVLSDMAIDVRRGSLRHDCVGDRIHARLNHSTLFDSVDTQAVMRSVTSGVCLLVPYPGHQPSRPTTTRWLCRADSVHEDQRHTSGSLVYAIERNCRLHRDGVRE